jgi:single-stranded DNA-binding protein
MDSWEDQQTGQKRIKLKVVAESLQFVDAHQVQNGTGVSQRQQRATPHKPASSPQDVSQQEWAETQRRSKAAAGSPEEDEPEDINFKTRIYKDVRQSPLNRRIF